MGLRTGNTDRLQSVYFIKRIREADTLGRRPLDGLIGQLDALGLGNHCCLLPRGSAREIAANGTRRGDTAGGRRDEQSGDRATRRHMLGDPGEQCGGVRRDSGGCRKLLRMGRGRLIDHSEARLDGRAMLGIDRAVDRRGEDDGAALLKANKGIAPGRRLGAEVRARDCDQTAAVGETRQRRSDMAIGGIRHPAADVRHRRERRVHQHGGRRDGAIEVIVDLRRVEAGHAKVGEEVGEQIGPGLGQLVKGERAAGGLRENGQEAGAGGRLQHAVAGRYGSGA